MTAFRARLPLLPLLLVVACVLALGSAGTASATPKIYNCANPNKLYPEVFNLHGVSRNKACAQIVKFGKELSGTKHPVLETLITCVGAKVDANNVETFPGTAQLTRTSWNGWTLSLPKGGGVKLTKGARAFSAAQQDFGCF